jgi:thioredoxin-like negative regulator of GroEL
MDANQKLAKEFGVSSVPTVIGFGYSNQLFSHIGLIDLKSLLSLTSV